MKRSPPKESDTQKLILDWLAAKRILAFRMNTGTMAGSHKGKRWFVRFGVPGMADILAFPHGGVAWLEIKSAVGKQSDEQKSFQQLVERHGHTYIVARSLDDVEGVI